MSGRNIAIKGGPELMAFLDAFPLKLQKGALRAAMTAGAKPVRDRARALAPRKTGQMAKAIKTGSPRIDPDGTVRIKVRLAGKHSFLGTFIEYGVRPHVIQARSDLKPRAINKRMNAEGFTNMGGGVLKIGDNFVSGAVLHPGFPARPFMRPALDLAAGEALNAMGDRLRSYLQSKASFTAPVTLEVDE